MGYGILLVSLQPTVIASRARRAPAPRAKYNDGILYLAKKKRNVRVQEVKCERNVYVFSISIGREKTRMRTRSLICKT